MSHVYTGAKSQLGYYLQPKNSVCLDILDRSSWDFLKQCTSLFLVIPKVPNTLEHTKKFILACQSAGVEHIVKLGSLGPWRCVHHQLDSFIRDSGIAFTGLEIAPLMSMLFTEQYQNQCLLDYRHGNPAPYLDTSALALAVEQCMINNKHRNRVYQLTGNQQLTIQQIKNIMIENGYPVDKIISTDNNRMHNISEMDADTALMTVLKEEYRTWYPPITDHLKTYFGIQQQDFNSFVKNNSEYFLNTGVEDKYL